ncbi:MAG TPA: hypothetical protein VGT41_04105 [Candidatus Babeliales bacterium]|nr:hypothetical protein [Candidatus Babeliales bacterium]
MNLQNYFFCFVMLSTSSFYIQGQSDHEHRLGHAGESKANGLLHSAVSPLAKHTMHESMMHGMYGNYSMTRDASGTSWVPTSSPQEGLHIMHNDWMLMFNGFSYLVMDVQRGKRGDKQLCDQNMFMFMAQRNFEKYSFGFRSMFSLEPLTIADCGYPLLLQTGETCDGKTPLIDRQHPHDLFMELAVVNTYQLTEDSSVFTYLALPGEPALGPPVYMMRFSSEYIPEAPLGHHWMDSTHITFGVITVGFIHKWLKLETSFFNGREPDQHRFDIEKPKLNSYSFRVSLNPTENLAFQVSCGLLKSPEQLQPDVNINRYVISAIYNKKISDTSNFQGAVIFGINDEKPGNLLPAFLIEGTLELHKKHLFFSRFEWVKKDDLFIEPDPFTDKIFAVAKCTVGYVYEFLTKHIKWGIGGLVDFPIIPDPIDARYGKSVSFMGFLQLRLV